MEDRILIGRITGSFGIRGEVKVYSYSGFADRFDDLETVYVEEKPYALVGTKKKPKVTVLKLEDVDDRDAAELLRGKEVYMSEEDLRDLPEDEYYVRDLIGMEVCSGDGVLGTLKEVLTDRPQDVYVVSLAGGGECMIPAVSSFVKEVDMDSNRIFVELIEGMVKE